MKSQIKNLILLGFAGALCSAATAHADWAQDMAWAARSMFDTAEKELPQYFPPSTKPDRDKSFYHRGNYYVAREFYSQTGGFSLLAVNIDDGDVYLMSKEFGGEFLLIGTVPQIKTMLGIMDPAEDARFTDNGNGTVTDKETNLTWKQCSEGQAWTGSTCSGDASTHTASEAGAVAVSFAGYSDWRLPNIRELQTIVSRPKHLPAISGTAFPGTPSYSFWSSTSLALSPEVGWLAHMSNGAGFYYSITSKSHARLVRGGSSSPILSVERPTADYTDSGNGAVTHAPTGLTWKQCSEGQTWSGTTCSGTAKLMTFDQANALDMSYAGYSDWRLPTHEELYSLLDFTQRYPAINGTIFPNTPSSSDDSTFWSSSIAYDLSKPTDSSRRWTVLFRNGYTNDTDSGSLAAVRLVRDGRSRAPSQWLTSTDCLFSWAEQTYPAYLAPAGGVSAIAGEYYYRYYATTKSYFVWHVKADHLYFLGPQTDNTATDMGAMSGWLALAGCQ